MAMQELGMLQYVPLSTSKLGSTSSFTTFVLDTAEYFFATVIQVPQTGTLKKIGLRWSAVTAGDAKFRICLEQVDAVLRAPVATTYAGKTLYAANAESAELSIEASAGYYYYAINGTTGISVTRGDMIAITVRCVSRTTGAATLVTAATSVHYNSNDYASQTWHYTTSWSNQVAPGAITLQYDTGNVQSRHLSGVANGANLSWNSTTNPTFRGNKIRFPYSVRVAGIAFYGDIDYDIKLWLFDSDEYTAFPGYPITWQAEYRPINGSGNFAVLCPTATLLANTWYRVVMEPIETAGANFMFQFQTFNDGSFKGIDALEMGQNCVYTSINDQPTSGSHVWTDDDTRRASIGLLIDAIDIPSGGGGYTMPSGFQTLETGVFG